MVWIGQSMAVDERTAMSEALCRGRILLLRKSDDSLVEQGTADKDEYQTWA
jgi:hypothetical protein